MMYPASTATIIIQTPVQGYAVPGPENAYYFPPASAPIYPGPPNQPPAYSQQMYPPQPPTAGGKINMILCLNRFKKNLIDSKFRIVYGSAIVNCSLFLKIYGLPIRMFMFL